jgi:hypothetical protein
MEDVILITGSMGAGKTTTLGEASDLLIARDITHAAIDLDAFGVAYLSGARDHDLMLRNLSAVCANYGAAGIRRLLIAAAVETAADFDRIRMATSAERVVVCRLRATPSVMEERVRARERGIFAERYIGRVQVLEKLLDRAALEDFTIETTDVTVTDVARELLQRAGWTA